jgi:hypothetical protein
VLLACLRHAEDVEAEFADLAKEVGNFVVALPSAEHVARRQAALTDRVVPMLDVPATGEDRIVKVHCVASREHRSRTGSQHGGRTSRNGAGGA